MNNNSVYYEGVSSSSKSIVRSYTIDGRKEGWVYDFDVSGNNIDHVVLQIGGIDIWKGSPGLLKTIFTLDNSLPIRALMYHEVKVLVHGDKSVFKEITEERACNSCLYNGGCGENYDGEEDCENKIQVQNNYWYDGIKLIYRATDLPTISVNTGNLKFKIATGMIINKTDFSV